LSLLSFFPFLSLSLPVFMSSIHPPFPYLFLCFYFSDPKLYNTSIINAEKNSEIFPVNGS
jgi:hypothetical protein